jgi:hypothetical protein
MSWTRSLCGVAVGLGLACASVRADNPFPFWPGPQAPQPAPQTPSGYPAAGPSSVMPVGNPPPYGYTPGMSGPAGPIMMPQAPPLPPPPEAMPDPQQQPLQQPQFPTPSWKPLNGLTGLGNAFCRVDPSENDTWFRVSLEGLQWWTRNTHTLPLVTAGFFHQQPSPGALFRGDTREAIGGNFDFLNFTGGRVSGVYYLSNPENLDGEYLFTHQMVYDIEGNFFLLEDKTVRRILASNGLPGSLVLSRPFFNPNTNLQDADPVSLTNLQAGTVSVTMTTRFMGGEANLRATPDTTGWTGSRISFLGGFRWLALDQKLGIDTSTENLPQGSGVHTQVTDDFTTFNRFWGGQFGTEVQFYFWEFLDVNLLAKFAFGESDETLRIRGTTAIQPAGGLSLDRGLLAQPSNIGLHSHDSFAFVPELGINVGLHLSPSVRLFGGFSWLYWSDILEPTHQIDYTVSVQPVQHIGTLGAPPQLGPTRPTVHFNETDFWAYGFNLGMEFSY